MKKELLACIGIFLAAMVSGYFTEEKTRKPPEIASRKQMGIITGKVLHSLQALLRKEGDIQKSESYTDMDISTQPHIRLSLAAGVITPFPDGAFRPDLPVMRGEALDMFEKVRTFISDHLLQKQECQNRNLSFSDIPSNHWLKPALESLSGIGALAGFQQPRLQPDSPIFVSEAWEIGSAIADYFSSDLLIAEVLPEGVFMRSKGTMTSIPLTDWKISWNQGLWETLPPNGLLAFPRTLGSSRNQLRLLLSHESFQPIGLPWLNVEPGVLWFIKLKRKPKSVQEVFVRTTRVPETIAESTPKRGVSPESEIRHEKEESESPKKIEPVFLREQNFVEKESSNEPPSVFAAESLSHQGFPVNQEALLYSDSTDFEEFPQKRNDESARLSPEAEEETVENGEENKDLLLLGVVINTATKKALAGATVLVGTKSYITDSDGKFRFMATKDELLEIIAYSEGFESLNIKHRVGFKSGPLFLSLKERFARFEGIVIDSRSGRPIRGATLKVGNRKCESDSGGRFQVSTLSPTFHQVTCAAPGYMRQVEIVFVNYPITRKALKLPAIYETRNQRIAVGDDDFGEVPPE